MLEAHGGCFHWKADPNPSGLIEIRPVDRNGTHCDVGYSACEISPAPIPTTSPRANNRYNAWVTATLVSDASKKVECEVFVDKISKMEILTSTRKVNVDNTESLDLQAFDENDNVFTSLTGLPFDWTVDYENILKPISFDEARMNVSSYYKEHEATGTDRYPVLGKNPGKAHIRASLRDPSRPVSTELDIIVIEPLKTEPDEAYILPLTKVNFILKTKKKYPYAIDGADGIDWMKRDMPSLQYKWSAADTSVVKIDPDMGATTGLQLGLSEITVRDTTLPSHNQKAEVHVVEPFRIELRFKHTKPCFDGAWHMAVGQTEELEILLYSEHGKTIIITNNIEFHIAESKSGFLNIDPSKPIPAEANAAMQWRKLESYSDTGLVVSALKAGKLTIHARIGLVSNAELGASKDYSEDGPTVSITVVVTSPVRIHDREVVLPVPAPIDYPSKHYQPPESLLQVGASGGSGVYEWTSDDPSVVFIPDSKLGRLVGKGAGSTKVYACDACNRLNKHEISVDIVHPAAPFFLTGPSEVEIGSSLPLTVAVTAVDGRRFSNCSSLLLDTSLHSPTNGANDALVITSPQQNIVCESQCSQDKTKGCWHLQVKALSEGFQEMRAALRHPSSSATHDHVYDTKPLSAFPSLQSSPGNHILLAIGSTITLTWRGGPNPWPIQGFRRLGASSGPGQDMADRISDAALYTHVAGVTALRSAAITHELGSWKELESANKTIPSVSVYTEDSYAVQQEHELLSVRPKGTYAYSISCVDVTYEAPIALELRAGNVPSAHNPEPAMSRMLVKLSCYPRLRVSPQQQFLGIRKFKQMEVKALTRVGGEETTLKPTDPLLRSLMWRIEQPDVAVVSRRGTVTGLKLGETILHTTLDHPDLDDLTETVRIEDLGLESTAVVTVRFDNFVIKAPTQHVVQNAHTLLYVEGSNGEVPGDAAFERVRCKWHTDSTAVELFPVLSQPGLSGPQTRLVVDGFAVGVLGRRPGTFVITAKVSIAPPNGTSAKSHEFEQKMELTVMEPFQLHSPASLLLPYGANALISTTWDNSELDVSYQVMTAACSPNASACAPKNVVKVSERGLITSRKAPQSRGLIDLEEDAVILISTPGTSTSNLLTQPSKMLPSLHTQRSQTRQVLSVRVEVRAVSHLALTASPYLSGPMCVGSNLTVEVVLRDSLGRTFDSLEGWSGATGTGGTTLKIAVNRPNLVRVHKRPMAVEAAAPGTSTEPTAQGVLSTLTFSAVGLDPADESATGISSAVVKLWLANQTKSINPLYVRLDLARPSKCGPPKPIHVRLHFKESTGWASMVDIDGRSGDEKVVGLESKQYLRQEWELQFKKDVANALGVLTDRIIVRAVDPGAMYVEFDIVPLHHVYNIHQDQWHLAAMFAGDEAPGSNRLPEELAVPNNRNDSLPHMHT